MMENNDWSQRSEEDALREMRQSMSPEEFRREYLNEPILPRDLDGLRPSCVIIDDMGEQYMETYAIIDTTTTLDKIKDLVSKMNDFEFKFDTNNNRIAYQEYKKQLKEAFNRLRYESWEEYQEANQYIDEHLKILSIW